MNTEAPWTVLCVDDEPAILSALRRVLRPEGCRVLLASGGAEALALLEHEPVDVVVSDMRMPGMDGAALLARVVQRWPDTGRILLTGFADTQAAISAINDGQVHRYISKPWDEHDLRLTIRQAAERRRLQAERDRLAAENAAQNEALRALNAELEARVQARTAELSSANERLKRNFLGSVRLMSHLLEMRSPLLAGHGKRVADLARRLAGDMGWSEDEVRDLFLASLLHDIGFVAIPEAIMTKPVGRLTKEEMAVYQRHPALGAQALLGLEESQGVAAIVRGHHERFDGAGFPDRQAGPDIPRGARALAIVSAWDDLLHGHVSGAALTPEQARTVLQRGRGTQFDPEMLDVFLQSQLAAASRPAASMQVDARQAQPGMRLAKDLISKDGILLLSAGHELNEELIKRIRQFAHKEGVELMLSVLPTA